MPRDLAARSEERVYIEHPTDSGRLAIPDITVIEVPPRTPVGSPSSAAVAEPLLIDFDAAEQTEGFIEIRDFRNGESIVTVIELVSISNKRGPNGRKKYLQKQNECLRSKCNLVEVDLLRGGRDVTLASRRGAATSFTYDYHASILRAVRAKKIEFFPFSLRSPLPAIPIPLREGDKDIVLDLQPLLNNAYANGLYTGSINYLTQPNPPLSPRDQQWATGLVKQYMENRGIA